jgi:putative colanic acid biosynthesis UDP-glucose lipid carrier transferase
MTATHIGRYSKYIRHISISMDLIVIVTISIFLFKDFNLNIINFILYQITTWIIIALLLSFYEIFRFTTPLEIISKLFKQFALFLLVIIAFFPFTKQENFNQKVLSIFIISCLFLITALKFLMYYYLKQYRLITGSNCRNTVIIGYTPEAIRLKGLFETRKDYGYNFLGFFSDKKSNSEIKGKLEDLFLFVLDNNIDEIYCSLNEISDKQLKEFIKFADFNNVIIKFIPDSKEIFSKNLKIDYYDFFPVLSLKITRLHEPVIKLFKRIFDIVFSIFVLVFVLSWMAPLLAILIKLESKGPVFFKQGRPGFEEKEFFCYKFRSMKINKTTEKEVSKDDPRITKIGKFLRKTSLDEMPQFFNVLIGDMSVVGPRPHLWSQNKFYSKKIKKYIVRHHIKPGITGLAQIKGFRGKIETPDDMINRIRLDVFYIENWSLLLDLKIIFQTIVNIYNGDQKAY